MYTANWKQNAAGAFADAYCAASRGNKVKLYKEQGNWFVSVK